MSEPEYIVRFARAISPTAPELLLSTSTEESLLTVAAETMEELRAERDRLRRALEEISTWNEVDDADLDVCRMQWRGCVAIARAALKEEGRA